MHMRCIQDLIDNAEGEEEFLPKATELIFASLAHMKSKATSNRKRKNVYRTDVLA
jgi:hypothetical protein